MLSNQKLVYLHLVAFRSMRKLVKYILIVPLISCSSSNQEKKLIGNWYSAENNRIKEEFRFYKDSLIIYDVFKNTVKWDVKRNQIHTYYLKEKGPTYKFQLSKGDQVLHLQLIGDKNHNSFEFVKAKSAFDFLEKTIDLKIDLPKSTTNLEYINLADGLYFNIYAGYKNNKLIVKTDYSSTLNDFNNEVKHFIENKREELKPFLKYNLIADKNITDSQIDSIKNILRENSIRKIFRTYKSDEISYLKTIDWFGKTENL